MAGDGGEVFITGKFPANDGFRKRVHHPRYHLTPLSEFSLKTRTGKVQSINQDSEMATFSQA